MSDRGPETGDTEAHVTAEGDGNEYAVERLVTREAGAAALRRLADGVANGSVELGDEEVTVAVPERFQLEFEYERDDEEAELEAELEWPIVDGEAVATERRSEPPERGDTEEPEMAGDEADLDHAGGDEEQVGEGEPAGEAEDDNPIEELIGVGRRQAKPNSNSIATAPTSGAGDSSTSTATSSPTAARITTARQRPETDWRA